MTQKKGWWMFGVTGTAEPLVALNVLDLKSIALSKTSFLSETYMAIPHLAETTLAFHVSWKVCWWLSVPIANLYCLTCSAFQNTSKSCNISSEGSFSPSPFFVVRTRNIRVWCTTYWSDFLCNAFYTNKSSILLHNLIQLCALTRISYNYLWCMSGKITDICILGYEARDIKPTVVHINPTHRPFLTLV